MTKSIEMRERQKDRNRWHQRGIYLCDEEASGSNPLTPRLGADPRLLKRNAVLDRRAESDWERAFVSLVLVPHNLRTNATVSSK